MESRIVYEVLKENLNQRIVLFLKNGFRFEGILLELDEVAIKLDDRKVGVTAISLDDISNVRRCF